MLGEGRLRLQPTSQLTALNPPAQQVGQLLPQRPRVVLIQPVVVLGHLAPIQREHGGQAFTVKVDGTDLHAIGTDVRAWDGTSSRIPADQDFDAVTPAGRVILEAEFEGVRAPQLLVATTGTVPAHALDGEGTIVFAGFVP